MDHKTRIHLNKFTPRPYQIPLLDAIENKGYKRVLAILPRRAGKDYAAWWLCIRECIRKTQVIYYIFPTYAQAKKALWNAVSIDGLRFLDLIPPDLIESLNSQEMIIKFKNKSYIQLVGSDGYNRLMGTNAHGMVFSEYALQDPLAWQYLRPILAASNGWALFISTPRGKNALWELFQIALHSPNWFAYKMTLDETKHLSDEAILEERKEMSEDLFMQEYMCFPSSMKVLTVYEMKSIADIKVNDLVISHSGRIRKVLGTIEREYEGELIGISSYGSGEDILCTPEHPIRVYHQSTQSYEWKQAKDISKYDRIVFPKITLGKVSLISYELCMLIAWYITEGSTFKNGVSFTVGTQAEVNRIKELLHALSLECLVYRGTAFNIVVNSVQLVDFFKVNCGTHARDKRIPFTLISTYEKEFFHELIKGDGCFSLHGNYQKFVYSTISQTLAYQVQLLANSLNMGYAAGISMRDEYKGIIEGREVQCQKSYQVNIGFEKGNARHNWLLRAKNSIAALVTRVYSIPYIGKVYNLKVQYDETYTVLGRAVHNCSFDLGVEGSIYGKYIDRMKLRGQIGMVPWETTFRVNTAWDIGRDTTAIIFFQSVGQIVRIIDYYEKVNENLEYFVKYLESKPYIYNKHFFPHDMRVTEWGGPKFTRVEKARQLGLKVTIVDEVSLEDGIEYVRSSLSKIWIDEQKCAQLIKCLENYRYEYDSKKQVYKSVPLHNWASHGSDCARYMCLSLPKTRDGLSAEELDKRYRETMYGTDQMPGFFRTDL